MISILIPSYNFDVTNLIETIHKQIELTTNKFEIICAEDGSTQTFSNEKIKNLKNVTYIHLKKNIGRSKIRNLLANTAKFKWLLFIDCDSEINNNFINNYINKKIDEKKIYYGETVYQKNKPEKDKILHWKYGKNIESKRKKDVFSSHHFLIQKKVFESIKFNEEIKGYGHEDTIFWIDLKKKNYKFEFIKNPVKHIGLETNQVFIKKTKEGLNNLYFLNKKYKLNNILIIRIQKKLSNFLLDHLIIITFQLTKKIILNNLLSKKPNIKLFQFYKLGYYCKITKNHQIN